VKINLNDQVRVKLTPLGRRALKRYYRELYQGLPYQEKPIEEDAHGYSTWQLGELMHKLGQYVPPIGFDLPFEPTIEIIKERGSGAA